MLKEWFRVLQENLNKLRIYSEYNYMWIVQWGPKVLDPFPLVVSDFWKS